MMKQQKTRVFIYEDGRGLWGTIEDDSDGIYTIRWDDGEVTKEPIKEFSPAGFDDKVQ